VIFFEGQNPNRFETGAQAMQGLVDLIRPSCVPAPASHATT